MSSGGDGRCALSMIADRRERGQWGLLADALVSGIPPRTAVAKPRSCVAPGDWQDLGLVFGVIPSCSVALFHT
jgi:hypothetical protein